MFKFTLPLLFAFLLISFSYNILQVSSLTSSSSSSSNSSSKADYKNKYNDCIAKCGKTDITCIAKCLGVPNPSSDDIQRQQECLKTNCATQIDPAEQQDCYANCAINTFWSYGARQTTSTPRLNITNNNYSGGQRLQVYNVNEAFLYLLTFVICSMYSFL